MTPVLASAAQAARWVSRRQPAADRDDLDQEAALVALECGSAEAGVVFEACRRRVGRAAFYWACPVSLPDGDHAVIMARGESLDGSVLVDDGSLNPESLAFVNEWSCRWERLQTALLAAEQHAARGLPRFVREMGAEAFAGRRYRMHIEMSERYGIRVTEVVNALGRYGRAIERSREVRVLRAAAEDLKRELIA